MDKLREISAREENHPLTPLAGRAYLSEDLPGIYLIAMRFDWGFGEPLEGVWASRSLEANKGRIWSVSGASDLFAQWPDGPWPTSRTTHGARAVRDCLPEEDDGVDEGNLDSALIAPDAAGWTLGQAVQAMTEDPVSDFSFEMLMDDAPVIVTRGETRADGWRATTRMDLGARGAAAGHEVVVMDARSTDDTVWMRMRGWPAHLEGCWLELEPDTYPNGIVALAPNEPAYFTAIAFLTSTGYVDETRRVIAAELPLEVGVHLLPGQILERLDTSQARLDQPVSVAVEHDGRRITGVRISGQAYLDAFEEAGAQLDDQLATLYERADFAVSFSQPEVDSHRPSSRPRQTMTGRQMESEEGCNRVGSGGS